MRSVWKGHIRFSLVMIPVRIYNAIDSGQSISFNQLHRECNGRIGYDKRCKKCSDVVPASDIVKGYEYEPDQYVLIEPEDFAGIKLKSTKVIEIEAFVNASEVHPTLYDAPYFIGPENEVAGKAYALLCHALKDAGKVGIGKVVLRDREDIAMIAPQDGGLMMYKLRYPKEVRSMKDVPKLEDAREVDGEQLELALNLLETMTASMPDVRLEDQYRDALKNVIESKIQGKEIVTYEEAEQPVVDIMTALKQSIEEAKASRQPMVKATGKARKGKAAAASKSRSAKRKRA